MSYTNETIIKIDLTTGACSTFITSGLNQISCLGSAGDDGLAAEIWTKDGKLYTISYWGCIVEYQTDMNGDYLSHSLIYDTGILFPQSVSCQNGLLYIDGRTGTSSTVDTRFEVDVAAGTTTIHDDKITWFNGRNVNSSTFGTYKETLQDSFTVNVICDGKKIGKSTVTVVPE